MSIVGIHRRGRYRGGRHKFGTANNADIVKHHVVVDDEFWAMLESERKAEETNNDCLWRIFTERTNLIRNLRKKVDALENAIQTTQSIGVINS